MGHWENRIFNCESTSSLVQQLMALLVDDFVFSCASTCFELINFSLRSPLDGIKKGAKPNETVKYSIGHSRISHKIVLLNCVDFYWCAHEENITTAMNELWKVQWRIPRWHKYKDEIETEDCFIVWIYQSILTGNQELISLALWFLQAREYRLV